MTNFEKWHKTEHAGMDCIVRCYSAWKQGETAQKETDAKLYDCVDAACDHERTKGSPGAGAMGAIIAYRDLIRGQRT